MANVVGISLKKFGKTYTFDTAGLSLRLGDRVIVKTTSGTELGRVVGFSREVDEDTLPQPLKKVVRKANDEDLARLDRNIEKQSEALKFAQEKIAERDLKMRLVDLDYAFDGSKLTFYFIAETRVDFRELVKDLAAKFKTRIELRQIGVRDKARMIGGLGQCGQHLCCMVFLSDLNPVSIRMAKEQDLPLNPLKISGVCGRLMCCLRYEFEAYKDFKKRAPGVGCCVETVDGTKGRVVEQNVLRERLKIEVENGKLLEVPLDQVKCVCSKADLQRAEKLDEPAKEDGLVAD